MTPEERVIALARAIGIEGDVRLEIIDNPAHPLSWPTTKLHGQRPEWWGPLFMDGTHFEFSQPRESSVAHMLDVLGWAVKRLTDSLYHSAEHSRGVAASRRRDAERADAEANELTARFVDVCTAAAEIGGAT